MLLWLASPLAMSEYTLRLESWSSRKHFRLYKSKLLTVIYKVRFQTSPVKSLSIQSMAEGKHHTNILHLQSLQELVITYAGLLVSVTGNTSEDKIELF